mmetsp:Transcript_25872/g.54979  ORF Transcript_25872/g.54979 Transcript_25872/m.54979 type:complete len:283 (-) Transcript_25872:104-952(-)
MASGLPDCVAFTAAADKELVLCRRKLVKLTGTAFEARRCYCYLHFDHVVERVKLAGCNPVDLTIVQMQEGNCTGYEDAYQDALERSTLRGNELEDPEVPLLLGIITVVLVSICVILLSVVAWRWSQHAGLIDRWRDLLADSVDNLSGAVERCKGAFSACCEGLTRKFRNVRKKKQKKKNGKTDKAKVTRGTTITTSEPDFELQQQFDDPDLENLLDEAESPSSADDDDGRGGRAALEESQARRQLPKSTMSSPSYWKAFADPPPFQIQENNLRIPFPGGMFT